MMPEERKQKMQQLCIDIKKLNAESAELHSQLRDLRKDCVHEFRPLTKKELADKWMSVSADCIICGQDLGWRCKENPKGYCEYDDNPDDCTHCHLPDERK